MNFKFHISNLKLSSVKMNFRFQIQTAVKVNFKFQISNFKAAERLLNLKCQMCDVKSRPAESIWNMEFAI